MAQAIKDPNSGNFGRIQIVKVWTKNGGKRQKEFNVVWGGDQKFSAKPGILPPVGQPVEVRTATYTTNIGAIELLEEWTKVGR